MAEHGHSESGHGGDMSRREFLSLGLGKLMKEIASPESLYKFMAGFTAGIFGNFILSVFGVRRGGGGHKASGGHGGHGGGHAAH